ncbi:MAG: zinc ribbon domain-containing protein [Thermodesulfobacteriota bacterium]|nr:zinc ribbon domain-containing protein [Thermodesulfobacteriota bacterium]
MDRFIEPPQGNLRFQSCAPRRRSEARCAATLSSRCVRRTRRKKSSGAFERTSRFRKSSLTARASISTCGDIGTRIRHRFVCEHCGLRAHSDLTASRNLARIGETAVSPRAAVNTPNVGDEHRLVLR